jgi:HEAT repeat protein
LSTRIGISAVMEELQGTKALSDLLPQLEQLTLSGLAQTRADACHFLGLSGDRRAVPIARRLIDDEDPEVREIAGETLALLGERVDIQDGDSG